jgi:hypothetical protein
MLWIDRMVRVPDDRRPVHTWGVPGWRGLTRRSDGFYLGVSKCNISQSRGAKFDNELSGYLCPGATVTHWAEITGPEGSAS